MSVEDPMVLALVCIETAATVADLAQTLDEAGRAHLMMDLVNAVIKGADRAGQGVLLEPFAISRRERCSLLMVVDAAVEHVASFGAGKQTTVD